ncbi:MAG: single-stranded DNA-binding protein [Clostridiales bacterium]|jgi:single-stranded DNA-binding protein|nr:single-stranded DNA-binding protein [Clostridiales bacterium]
MLKMFVTNAVVSKGYDSTPAFRFSESTENPSVRFRIGSKVYDKKAEKEHRYINLNVKAFGYLTERIKNMKLDAGSYVNIIGRFDEEHWEDQTTKEKKSAFVLIVDEIEYSNGGGNGRQNGDANSSASSAAPAPAAPPAYPTQPPDNFTGFEGFGGKNPYFSEN